jgi:hypothetical protein
VFSGDAPGTPLDLAPHLGRVVMLTGALDPKLGLSKAELVEVASPLLSFALKSMLTGDDPLRRRPPARPQGPALSRRKQFWRGREPEGPAHVVLMALRPPRTVRIFRGRLFASICPVVAP